MSKWYVVVHPPEPALGKRRCYLSPVIGTRPICGIETNDPAKRKVVFSLRDAEAFDTEAKAGKVAIRHAHLLALAYSEEQLIAQEIEDEALGNI